MKTILLADDEPSIRTLVRTTLEDPLYQILEAKDGVEALELARNEVPDLVVLDWRMPGMSGIEVAEAMRHESKLQEIPIIMLTAMGQAWNQERARLTGVTSYLTKPFSPLALLDLVESIFAAVQSRELYASADERFAAGRAPNGG
jgi:two-component system, OmpR family, phosphate regulon response regulator PhoB